MTKRKVLILHGLGCHYEMIPSVLEQFKDYEIDLIVNIITGDLVHWFNSFYAKLNVPFNIITSISHKNYDLCCLPTDDDKKMYEFYKKNLVGLPVYIINHLKGVNRTKIDDSYKYCIDIHGIQEVNGPYHFCGSTVLDIEKKIFTISKQIISVAIIGDIIIREENLLEDLKRKFTNFHQIEFFIINRRITSSLLSEGLKYNNVHFFLNCDAQTMFQILERCHYIYFFSPAVDLTNSSGCFGLSYSFLCRLICNKRRQIQLENETPLFTGEEDKFELKPLQKEQIIEIEKERTKFISKTSNDIKNLLSQLSYHRT